MDDYIAALQTTREAERSNAELINAYTRLADAYAAVSNAASSSSSSTPSDEKTEQPPVTGARIPPSITGSKAPEPPHAASTSSGLRADLAAANRSIQDLNAQLASLRDALETSERRENAAVAETGKARERVAKLETDRASLLRRLRDKDGELKEKARLVANVQDEMVGMEMQMNVAEERAKKLEGENTELVERWMRRKGDEAERMNRGSGWS